MNPDEWVSAETAAGIVYQHEVAYVLVEEFIQRHPDASKMDDGRVMVDRERLLAWLVRSNSFGPPDSE